MLFIFYHKIRTLCQQKSGHAWDDRTLSWRPQPMDRISPQVPSFHGATGPLIFRCRQGRNKELLCEPIRIEMGPYDVSMGLSSRFFKVQKERHAGTTLMVPASTSIRSPSLSILLSSKNSLKEKGNIPHESAFPRICGAISFDSILLTAMRVANEGLP